MAKENIGKINVFPNPYLGVNSAETSRYSHFVTFSHLPPKANIRIFDMSGTLVRTIEKDDPLQFTRWDLQNQNQLPVASGMYIAHIELPGLGESRILKLAVIKSSNSWRASKMHRISKGETGDYSMLRHSFRISTILLALVLASATAFADGQDPRRYGRRSGTADSGRRTRHGLGRCLDRHHCWSGGSALEPSRSAQVRIQRGHPVFDDVLSGGYRINYLATGANFKSVGSLALNIKALDFGAIPVTTEANPTAPVQPIRRPSSPWA